MEIEALAQTHNDILSSGPVSNLEYPQVDTSQNKETRKAEKWKSWWEKDLKNTFML